MRGQSLLVLALAAALVASPAAAAPDPAQELADNQKLIQAKQQEIDELNTKITALSAARDNAAAQAEAVTIEVQRLQQKVAKAELELKQTQLAAQAVEQEQALTEQGIEELERGLNDKRQQLRELIRHIHASDQSSWIGLFLSEWSLSSVLADRAAYLELQRRTVQLIQDMRSAEAALREQREQLSAEQRQLASLEGALAEQQSELAASRSAQQAFLQQKRADQVASEQRLAVAEQARQEIEQDIFSLRGAGVTLKLTEARDIARYAGQLTGVRPALLLAVLKVESNLGTSLGGGTFPEDMHPASRDAFLRLTKKLGLDPYTVPISARPRRYSGWGGAMGPGQFMPETWERVEEKLQKLLGHPPNPYELMDAFVGTAVLLAERGASSQATEYEAVNRYLAGPNWQRFTWYGDRVLAVAREYEKEGI